MKVSVILTTYNRVRCLPQTLDSLLQQSLSNFELIICDDCSTDATAEICRRYAANDLRIRYYRQAKNLKMPENLNVGLRHATGEYIANVHDGDYYEPDLLSEWATALDRHPDAPFVFNDYKWLNADGTTRLCQMPPGECFDGWVIADHFFRTFTSCVWGTVMARRSAYETHGFFDARFGFYNDVDMWLRLACGSRIAYVHKPLMTLTPREATHPYAFVNWRLLFWNCAIYRRALSLYHRRHPSETEAYRRGFRVLRRKEVLYNLALCIKWRRWELVGECLGMCRDSDDPVLAAMGKTFGNRRCAPAWYEPTMWEKTSPLSWGE
jgi:glycosyltransferase involved in cell wall biosynthesis